MCPGSRTTPRLVPSVVRPLPNDLRFSLNLRRSAQPPKMWTFRQKCPLSNTSLWSMWPVPPPRPRLAAREDRGTTAPAHPRVAIRGQKRPPFAPRTPRPYGRWGQHRDPSLYITTSPPLYCVREYENGPLCKAALVIHGHMSGHGRSWTWALLELRDARRQKRGKSSNQTVGRWAP